MNEERLKILLHNVLCEIVDKTEIIQSNQFKDWLTNEVGMTNTEFDILQAENYLPIV